MGLDPFPTPINPPPKANDLFSVVSASHLMGTWQPQFQSTSGSANFGSTTFLCALVDIIFNFKCQSVTKKK
jgi:hypothetical protein